MFKSKRRIEFAPTTNMDRYAELADDFIQRVLGLEAAFVSDESRLRDFHTEINNDEVIQRTREIYGVDITDVQSRYIHEILARIDEHQRGRGKPN